MLNLRDLLWEAWRQSLIGDSDARGFCTCPPLAIMKIQELWRTRVNEAEYKQFLSSNLWIWDPDGVRPGSFFNCTVLTREDRTNRWCSVCGKEGKKDD